MIMVITNVYVHNVHNFGYAIIIIIGGGSCCRLGGSTEICRLVEGLELELVTTACT